MLKSRIREGRKGRKGEREGEQGRESGERKNQGGGRMLKPIPWIPGFACSSL